VPGLRLAAALPALFAAGAAAAQPHLVEVSEIVGVTHVPATRSRLVGAGVVIFDYDRDGRADLLFADDAGPCHLYRNEPGGDLGFRFREVGLETGLASPCRGLALSILDYDRDGWEDVAVGGAAGVILLRNEAGTFREVTAIAGLGGETSAAALSAADFDRDGYPDLYVGRYVVAPRFPIHGCGANRLYRNRGDGTFEEVAAALGAADEGCTLAAAFLDVDGDGDLDLVVANDFGQFVRPNEILRNDGDRFVATAGPWGAQSRMYAMGFTAGDVDGDGRIDVFFTNIGRNLLLRGGPAGFVDETERFGVGLALQDGKWRSGWGAALADFDLDGMLDLYVAAGFLLAEPPIANAPDQPNTLFAGQPGLFALVAGEGADPRSSRGVAVGDLDGDGVPDLGRRSTSLARPRDFPSLRFTSGAR
jgi:hypothetical protein